jgi:protein-tyrosine phosphatase
MKPYLKIFLGRDESGTKNGGPQTYGIRDLSTTKTEAMLEIFDKIDEVLSEGRPIYVNCFGGKGRTGTVVGCYFVRHGIAGGEALDLIRVSRNRIIDPVKSPETEGQKRMVCNGTRVNNQYH